LSTVDDLLFHFRHQVALPWRPDTPPEYRVWIMHYDKALDRRVQARLPEFEDATRRAEHGWSVMALAPLVAPWLAAHELFDGLVNQPDELPSILPEFEEHVVAKVRGRLDQIGPNDLLVLSGAGALFGLLRVSRLTQSVADAIQGRLLLLFPGRHSNGAYRLLDARDGWSYRAIPIPA
jgi:Domain of unknown function (DUF1788)